LPILQKFTQIESDELQLHLAKVIAYVASNDNNKKTLVEEGWLKQLNSWAKSENKHTRLFTIYALDSLLKEESIAIKIVQDHGMEIFIQLASIIDLDIHKAVENILHRLETKENLNSYMIFGEIDEVNYKLNDDFELIPYGVNNY